MATQTEQFIVNGRVQGVGFRYFVRGKANGIGVTGFVRNLPDGSVECVARGTPEQLEQLSEELHRGPPVSRVTQVTRTPASDSKLQPGFHIQR